MLKVRKNRVYINMRMTEKALKFAMKAHSGQVRKGTDTPYVYHVMEVGMLLSNFGCSEEAIAAGLLHDTVEDAGITLEELEKEFGKKVAEIVSYCSEDKTKTWKERKQHTIDMMAKMPLEAVQVTVADKLSNVRSMASDYKKVGEKLFDRFRKGREDQAWYYKGIAGSVSGHRLYEKFKSEVDMFF